MLHKKYGQVPGSAVKRRVEEEWHAAERSESILDVAALVETSHWLKGQGQPYWMRSFAGSSFIL